MKTTIHLFVVAIMLIAAGSSYAQRGDGYGARNRQQVLPDEGYGPGRHAPAFQERRQGQRPLMNREPRRRNRQDGICPLCGQPCPQGQGMKQRNRQGRNQGMMPGRGMGMDRGQDMMPGRGMMRGYGMGQGPAFGMPQRPRPDQNSIAPFPWRQDAPATDRIPGPRRLRPLRQNDALPPLNDNLSDDQARPVPPQPQFQPRRAPGQGFSRGQGRRGLPQP